MFTRVPRLRIPLHQHFPQAGGAGQHRQQPHLHRAQPGRHARDLADCGARREGQLLPLHAVTPATTPTRRARLRRSIDRHDQHAALRRRCRDSRDPEHQRSAASPARCSDRPASFDCVPALQPLDLHPERHHDEGHALAAFRLRVQLRSARQPRTRAGIWHVHFRHRPDAAPRAPDQHGATRPISSSGVASLLLGMPTSGSIDEQHQLLHQPPVLRLVLPGHIGRSASGSPRYRSALRIPARLSGALQPHELAVRHQHREPAERPDHGDSGSRIKRPTTRPIRSIRIPIRRRRFYGVWRFAGKDGYPRRARITPTSPPARRASASPTGWATRP